MKYTFKQIDNISGRNAETTVEFSADSLTDILQHFEMFLRGSGFHPSGTLDFVEDEEYYNDPIDFNVESVEEPWNGVAPSTAMQWTVNELMKGSVNKEPTVCPVCKIDIETMANYECWDQNCPKGKDAN
jgi:hypothetical protein